MAITKPSIPKGTRDFSPAEMSRRNYMFDIIKDVFRTHRFLPLETPAMENLSTLLGKYGEEGDKLLFRILNSGDFTRELKPSDLGNPAATATKISEKGLRYDLTVPFARYVVQHRGDIVFPFRRYQVQPVWRADRPQKGRYREFYQCDVDIVGSRSLLNEAELVQIVDKVFDRLGISVTVKLNNRKILAGIAQAIGHADRMMDITIAIDKIDKIGMEAVCEELAAREISPEAIGKLKPILKLEGDNTAKLNLLKNSIKESDTGLEGIAEMEKLLGYCCTLGLDGNLEVDLSLARGLNYYTGTIFEVKANDFQIGSICGGGRYDDLTGIFGMPDTPGVGISFGADRIYNVMNGLGLFPEEATVTTRVLFLNFGPAEELAAMKELAAVRSAGIPSEIYPDSAKIKKQMDYANKRSIPYVVIIGSDELASGTAVVKNMRTGDQQTVRLGTVAGAVSM